MGSIESVLKDNGYKLTEQRKLILRFLKKNGPQGTGDIRQGETEKQ